MKKHICLFLAVIFALTSLVSCSGDEKKTFKYVVDENLFNVIAADGTSQYNIVRPESASSAVIDACLKLKSAIAEATGVVLEIKSDFEKEGYEEFKRQDCEILIGHTNREESAHALSELSRAKDFAILQEGTRIAVSSYDERYIDSAVSSFIEKFVNEKNCTVEMEHSEKYVSLFDYPIKSFSVNGKDISEYKLVYSDPVYSECVEDAANSIFENYGVRISAVKGSSADALNDIYSVGLRFVDAPTSSNELPSEELLPFETRVISNDNGLFVCSGIFVDKATDAQSFIDRYFTKSELSGDIEYTIETSSEMHENLYVRTDDTELLNEIDEKAAAYRDAVVNSESEYSNIGENSQGTIYYVSNDGSDSNDGKSPETAWASIKKVNSVGFTENDCVLFRRGDEFRGRIESCPGVTYSAYGSGAKPIINGSYRDLADPSYWVETDVENVYRCTNGGVNVGNIVFDYSGIIGNYDETIGELQVVGLNDFNDYHDLKEDLDFCSDILSDNLYLYCEGGNPGERFDSIEICEQGNLFSGSAKNVTVDNLMFIFGGSHGVGSGTVENRTVKNCIFAWIGGSILKGYGGANTTRYGNAIEVYGGCDGFHVENNWIYQIYDTGITHQYSTDDQVIVMKNIEYNNNIIELCHWSIEYYNRGETPGSLLENVHVHDNVVLNGCYGWGSVGRESGGALHNSFEIVDDVTDYVVEDNIFAYSKGNVVRYNQGGDLKIKFKHNTYVQYYDRLFGYVLGTNEPYNARAVSILTETMHEEDPIIVFLMHDEEREAEEAAKKAAEEASALEEQ